MINVFFYVLYRIYDVNFGGGESSYGGIRIDRSNEFLLLEQQWIVLREVCDADYQNVLKAIFAAEKGQSPPENKVIPARSVSGIIYP